MKGILNQGFVLMILLFVNTKSMAQDLKVKQEDGSTDDIFVSVEIAADFPGSIYKFRDFVKDNFKIPNKAVRKKVKGEIPVQFIVEKDGSLSDIKLLNNLGFGLDEEALRVIQLSPKWNSASRNGKRVKGLVIFRIYIDTNEEKEKRIYFEKK
ncbi:energy transducer TonB [Flavobacterium defluvii]|uniref:TonB protein C-terminal n=1 Tax=Flavobacterium defluvii TaxID=370979 RepID=A0A1M5FQE0_9FLAO|nr:energy transducer TonB [Flavobacterium defluvii]SHF93770.1 TonB protein C-terminal [Flavobacterium defluvii]